MLLNNLFWMLVGAFVYCIITIPAGIVVLHDCKITQALINFIQKIHHNKIAEHDKDCDV